jgi:hypothetical protein
MTENKPLDREAAKQDRREYLSARLRSSMTTLERWRQCILEELRATSEGMPADGDSAELTGVLDEIEDSKRLLD